MSISEMPPGWAIIWRSSPAIRSGSIAPLRANSRRFGRSRSPRWMSLNGGLPWLVTTRIISSGVTPFAVIAAMNEPAEVPT
jgi:hypothetical protein